MFHRDNLALTKLFIYSYSGYRKPHYCLACSRNVGLINFPPRPNLKVAYISQCLCLQSELSKLMHELWAMKSASYSNWSLHILMSLRQGWRCWHDSISSPGIRTLELNGLLSYSCIYCLSIQGQQLKRIKYCITFCMKYKGYVYISLVKFSVDRQWVAIIRTSCSSTTLSGFMSSATNLAVAS